MHTFYLIQCGHCRTYAFTTLCGAYLIGRADYAGAPFSIRQVHP